MDGLTQREALQAKLRARLRALSEPEVAVLTIVVLMNLAVLIGQAPALVHMMYLNSDHASALVLPALAGSAPSGAIVNLGNHPWYEFWIFMRATSGLPGYREIWEAAPFVVGLAGSATVAAGAWYAFGKVGGLLSLAALVAVSEPLRGILYVPEAHGSLALHLGVNLGALLFVRERANAGRLSLRLCCLVGLPLAAFTGVGITDQLLLVGGLVPFVLAPLLCFARSRANVWRAVGAFALATAALSGVIALLVTEVMHDEHILHAPFPVDFVSSSGVVAGLQNMATSLTSLGGGDFFGAPVAGSNLLLFLAGVLTLSAFAVLLRRLWQWSYSSARVPGQRAPHADTEVRELFIAYWGLVLICALLAFALTSVSASAENGRYLLGAWAAAAALLALLGRNRGWRRVVVLGVVAFAVVNVHFELTNGVESFGVAPDQRIAGAIEHFAQANDASVGYASYWDAAPVTWESRLRLKVYPIAPCPPPGLCPFYNNQISTWYRPRAGIRTFLIIDTRPNIPSAVSAAPGTLGRPVAQLTVGEGLTVLVYNYDVAARFGPSEAVS